MNKLHLIKSGVLKIIILSILAIGVSGCIAVEEPYGDDGVFEILGTTFDMLMSAAYFSVWLAITLIAGSSGYFEEQRDIRNKRGEIIGSIGTGEYYYIDETEAAVAANAVFCWFLMNYILHFIIRMTDETTVGIVLTINVLYIVAAFVFSSVWSYAIVSLIRVIGLCVVFAAIGIVVSLECEIWYIGAIASIVGILIAIRYILRNMYLFQSVNPPPKTKKKSPAKQSSKTTKNKAVQPIATKSKFSIKRWLSRKTLIITGALTVFIIIAVTAIILLTRDSPEQYPIGDLAVLDLKGPVKSVKYENNNEYTIEFDEMGRITNNKFYYEVGDEMNIITNPTSRLNRVYDEKQRLAKISFDNTHLEFEYDSKNKIIKSIRYRDGILTEIRYVYSYDRIDYTIINNEIHDNYVYVNTEYSKLNGHEIENWVTRISTQNGMRIKLNRAISYYGEVEYQYNWNIQK